MAAMLAVSSSAVVFHRFGGVTMSNPKSSLPSSSVCFAWRRETEVDIDVGIDEKPFVYRRASPAERWPNSHDELQQQAVRESVEELQGGEDGIRVRVWNEGEGLTSPTYRRMREEKARERERAVRESVEELQGSPPGEDGIRVKVSDEAEDHTSPIYRLMREDKARDKAREREIFHRPQKGQIRRLKRMTKLALKRAGDWESRTERLANAICELELARPVADVLEDWPEQLNNEDLSVVLGNVGRENWRRALELYECLNLRKWYTPNTRMLATILGILGRSNQVDVARELFLRAEPELTCDHIQVSFFTV